MIKKKGYALLMVLIVLMVLSLIGTAIISYSTSNFKLKKQYSDDYKAQYIAEGGINQSYGVLVILADEAGSKTDFENKIKGFKTDSNDSYYDDLYGGDLEITLTTEQSQLLFDGSNIMEIEITSTYDNEEVIGKFKIIYDDGSFLIALESKIF